MNCAYSRTDNLHSADTARMSARVVEDEDYQLRYEIAATFSMTFMRVAATLSG
jgi:hypothetical protein